MKLLIVAATVPEIGPFCDHYGVGPAEGAGPLTVESKGKKISVLVTGAGMIKTAFWLGRLGGSAFDVAINTGVGGSFGRFSPGDLVRVSEDRFAELGAEDG